MLELTILAGLVLVISESTIERSQLSKLISLELVLAFWDRRSSLDNVVDELLGFVDLFFGICHDQAVQVFFLITGVCGIGSTFAFFDRAFASNCNFGARFRLHFLEGIATRSNK